MQLSFETATHLQVNPVASVRSLPKLGPETTKSTAGGHGARRRLQVVGSVFTRRPRLSERDIERLSQQHSCKKQAQKSVLAFSHVTKQAYDPLHKGATLEVLTRTGYPTYTRARGRSLHAQCEGRQMLKRVQVVQDRTRVIVCPGCACVRSCTRGAGAGRTTGSLLLRPRLRVDRPSSQRISTEASPRDSMRTCMHPCTSVRTNIHTLIGKFERQSQVFAAMHAALARSSTLVPRTSSLLHCYAFASQRACTLFVMMVFITALATYISWSSALRARPVCHVHIVTHTPPEPSFPYPSSRLVSGVCAGVQVLATRREHPLPSGNTESA